MLGMKKKQPAKPTTQRHELRRQLDRARQAFADCEALRIEIQLEEGFNSPSQVSSLVYHNKREHIGRSREMLDKYRRLGELETEAVDAARLERDLRATAPQWIKDRLADITAQRKAIIAEQCKLLEMRDFQHGQIGRVPADREGERKEWEKALAVTQQRLQECSETLGRLTDQSNAVGRLALEADPQPGRG